MKKMFILLILAVTTSLYAEDITRKLNVIGHGKIDIEPNAIVVNTGVDSGNQVIALALDENSKIVNSIIKGLTEIGIAKESIKTTNYNVRYHVPYSKIGKDREEYRVSNSISVTVNDLDQIDSVLDSLVKHGANKIQDLRFIIKNRDIYRNELTKMALKDARSKADFIASEEGMKIVGIVSISENSGYYLTANNDYSALRETYSGNPGLSPGTQNLSLSFSVIYELEPI